jgi:hypothetical protein
VSDLAWSPSGRWIAIIVTERTLYLDQSVHIVDVTGEDKDLVLELTGADGSDVLLGWVP